MDASDSFRRNINANQIKEPAETLLPAKMIRALLRARSDAFGRGIFSDPGWDILLDLFISQKEGGRLSVSDLGVGNSGVPATAIRYIGILQTAGLVLRVPDPADRRRSHVDLTSKGRDAMEALLRPFAS